MNALSGALLFLVALAGCAGSKPAPQLSSAPPPCRTDLPADLASFSTGDVGDARTVVHAEPDTPGESHASSSRLPPEVIQKVVRERYDALRQCYEAGQERDPELQGRIATRFVVERDGSVRRVMLNSWQSVYAETRGAGDAGGTADQGTACTTLRDDTALRCMVSVFRKLRFPAPDVGIVTVQYPIMFAADE